MISGSVDNYGWMLIDTHHWSGANIPFSKFRAKEYGELIPYLEIGTM